LRILLESLVDRKLFNDGTFDLALVATSTHNMDLHRKFRVHSKITHHALRIKNQHESTSRAIFISVMKWKVMIIDTHHNDRSFSTLKDFLLALMTKQESDEFIGLNEDSQLMEANIPRFNNSTTS
jgi:abortive infection bacteriophage resistance protein